MSEKKVIAVVQARMGSSRFPGKVLEKLAGRPVLWHVVERLRRSERVNTIVVATSTKSVDDAIIKFCQNQDITVVRGPEENVLERYRLAVADLDPDVLVRVTGDAPLVDPACIDRMISKLIESGADRCIVDPDIPSIHCGFSVVGREAFDQLVSVASNDPVAKEHVTGYFQKDSSFIQTVFVSVPEEQQFEARISVDTPADLNFLEELYERLDAPAGMAEVDDITKILKKEPGLLQINQNVSQKGLHDQPPTILIYCEGGGEFGWGHVSRAIAIGDELRSSHGVNVNFALLGTENARRTIEEQAFDVEQINRLESEDEQLQNLIKEYNPDAVVIDLHASELSKSQLDHWGNQDILVVGIDEITDRRLKTDFVFYPPVPQVGDMDWSGYGGTVLSGWEWVVVDRDFRPHYKDNLTQPLTVLVTMGGSDPENITQTAVEGLIQLDEEIKAVVVLGSGYKYEKQLNRTILDSNLRSNILHEVNDMRELMLGSDLAIGSYGVTAFELACMNVPALHICRTASDARACSVLENQNLAQCLGVSEEVRPAEIRLAVSKMLNSQEKLTSMREACSDQVDNQGAHRIAERIMSEI